MATPKISGQKELVFQNKIHTNFLIRRVHKKLSKIDSSSKTKLQELIF